MSEWIKRNSLLDGLSAMTRAHCHVLSVTLDNLQLVYLRRQALKEFAGFLPIRPWTIAETAYDQGIQVSHITSLNPQGGMSPADKDRNYWRHILLGLKDRSANSHSEEPSIFEDPFDAAWSRRHVPARNVVDTLFQQAIRNNNADHSFATASHHFRRDLIKLHKICSAIASRPATSSVLKP